MLKALYGSLKIKKNVDYVFVSLKILYIIYTVPFLIFALCTYIYTLSFHENPFKQEIGVIKRILLHISAIFWSFVIYVFLLKALVDFGVINP
jgi:hypothetical protein